MVLRWGRWHGWAALGVALLMTIALMLLVRNSALDAGVPWWGKLLLVVVAVIAFVATAVVADHWPARGSPWHAWLAPRPLAGLFLAVFLVFASETDLISHFLPTATESERGIIQATVSHTDSRIGDIYAAVVPGVGSTSRIGQHIAGLWGEPGCAVAYRFTLNSKALTIDRERRPDGAPSLHLIATVSTAKGNTIEVVGEKPDMARGQAATFTYWSNGVIERLRWDDRSRPVPLELDRCI